ncbi:MAG: hypothetical protein JW818_06460 [Pirellulales bacterium]|nr:hypothetical protein [Pirellulales bacterium]
MVLETDADRERFKVKRRFQMRDAERFFAEGRAAARFELVRQQMLAAGVWRAGLRRKALEGLAELGRDIEPLEEMSRRTERFVVQSGRLACCGPVTVGMSAPGMFSADLDDFTLCAATVRTNVLSSPYYLADDTTVFPVADMIVPLSAKNPMGLGMGAMGGMAGEPDDALLSLDLEALGEDFDFDIDSPLSPANPFSRGPCSTVCKPGWDKTPNWDAGRPTPFFSEIMSVSLDDPEPYKSINIDKWQSIDRRRLDSFEPNLSLVIRQEETIGEGVSADFNSLISLIQTTVEPVCWSGNIPMCCEPCAREFLDSEALPDEPDSLVWLLRLFPALPAAPSGEKPKPPVNAWPAEARELAGSLVRKDVMDKAEDKLQGGLIVRQRMEWFDRRYDEPVGQADSLALVSARAWLARTGGQGSPATVHWCDENQRGVWSRGFQIGQVRKSTPEDLRRAPLPLDFFAQVSLERLYPEHLVSVQTPGKDRAELILRDPDALPGQEQEVRFLIDTHRNVVLRIETRSAGRLVSTSTFDQFVEAAGVWWPGRVTVTDAKGRRVCVGTTQFEQVDQAAFQMAFDRQLAGRDRVLLFQSPLPKLTDARRRIAQGQGRFEDHFVLLLRAVSNQEWDKAKTHLADVEKTAGPKPGLAWLRDALLLMSRDHQLLKKRLIDRANKLVQTPETGFAPKGPGSPSPGQRPGDTEAQGVLVGPTGQPVGSRTVGPLARNAVAEAPAPRAMPWAGRTAGPSARGHLAVATAGPSVDKDPAVATAEPSARGALAAGEQCNDLFFASQLLALAEESLSVQEKLELLDILRPVFARQTRSKEVMKHWLYKRLELLEEAKQTDQVMRLRKQIAKDYPRDASSQEQYFEALVEMGESQAALDWIDRVLKPEFKWTRAQEDSLRQERAQLLWNRGRFAELQEYAAKWVKRNSPHAQPYACYLSALVVNDREKEANRLATEWLAAAQTPGELEPATAARLTAAIDHALADGWNQYTNYMDPRWYGPMAKTAWLLAGRTDQYPIELASLADRIVDHGHFRDTDACDGVRLKALARLLAEMDHLPANQVKRFVDWIDAGPAPELPDETWNQVLAGLQKRLAAEKNPPSKQILRRLISDLLYDLRPEEEQVDFLRRQIVESAKRYRSKWSEILWDRLLEMAWTPEHEELAFELLLPEATAPGDMKDENGVTSANRPHPAAAPPPSPKGRGKQVAHGTLLAGTLHLSIPERIVRLHKLTDEMVKRRFEFLMEQVKDQHKLTRTELLENQYENQQRARAEFAQRLAKAKSGRTDELARWIELERLHLTVLSGGDLKQVEADAWKLLDEKKPGVPTSKGFQRVLDTMCQNRCLTLLSNLAARKTADPASVDRLLKYLNAAIYSEKAVSASNGKPELDKAALEAQAGRRQRFQQMKGRLLIALDRPKPLEQALGQWIRTDDPDGAWRRMLGYLAAEQGRLDEAVKLFETLAEKDLLQSDDHRAMAGWYQVLADREKSADARRKMYEAQGVWMLTRRWLQGQLSLVKGSRETPPQQMHEDVPMVFRIVFQKDNPADHLGLLLDFYQATRDFRLLECLADSVVGQTAGKVYPCLRESGKLLNQIHDEATVDQLVARIETLRARAKTPVDRRALDLLESLVERRAAELPDQPGPHAQKALAEMRRAFAHKWTEGEPRPMAELLGSMGQISDPKLAEEQLRELRLLYDRAARGSLDRFHLAHQWASTLWAYNRHDQAIDVLSAALTERQQATGGVLLSDETGPFETLIHYLESRRHFAQAEDVLQRQMTRPLNDAQHRWLVERLYQTYTTALEHRGKVSLGEGVTLYQALRDKLLAGLATDDHAHRRRVVDQLCGLFRVADRIEIGRPTEDLLAFAGDRLPKMLKTQTSEYQEVVSCVADTVYDLAGPLKGLGFLIERIENQPGWMRFQRQDGWDLFGQRLAKWRFNAQSRFSNPELNDLESLLLPITLAALRRDLEHNLSTNYNYRYDSDGQWIFRQASDREQRKYFWEEKAGDFAKTAEEVLAAHPDSNRIARRIADYFWDGLGRDKGAVEKLLDDTLASRIASNPRDRAIEILLDAHRCNFLDTDGQSKLVDCLIYKRRFGETIPVLESLVRQQPDQIHHPMRLMESYFHTRQPKAVDRVLAEMDAHFHQDGLWDEEAARGLAWACLVCHRYAKSIAYYDEAISLRRRTRGRRLGDNMLSEYFLNQARAYNHLGKTHKMVDAACAAIVCWGPQQDRRRNALDTLQNLLYEAKNLDAFVTQLDKETASSGVDKPIVRKALGQVYLKKNKPGKAIVQLRKAIRLEPNDLETHKALLSCYDKQNDKPAAAAVLLEMTRRFGDDLKLYQDLGDRYAALKRPAEAERAYTSMVEAQPNESASHSRLARLRQKQDRWPEAVDHWKEVARIRSLEPTGLLHLAEAQIHLKRWPAARATLARLREHPWPDRFRTVPDQVRKLEAMINQQSKP